MTAAVTAVDCSSCKTQGHCPAECSMHRATLLAWANDRDVLPCPFYLPRFERGVEGVLPSPRPTRLVCG
jgi:hypothetical protein